MTLRLLAYFKLLVFCLLFCIGSQVHASDPNGIIDSLNVVLQSTSAHEKRAEVYMAMASHYQNILNQESKFDSLAQLGIMEAEASFDPKVIVQINIKYLSNRGPSNNNTLAEQIVQRTEKLSVDLDMNQQFDIWILLTKTNLQLFNIPKAHSYALKAMSYSSSSKNNIHLIQSHLAIGKCSEFNRQYVEAFQNYMNALYETELLESHREQKKYKSLCYEYLFNFHQKIKNYDEAAKYKKKIIDFIIAENPIDSSRLYWQNYDLAGLSLNSGQFAMIKHRLENILAYAANKHNLKLKRYTLTLYRSLLIETNNFEGFHNLYFIRFPEELQKLKTSDANLYFRIAGYIQQHKQQYDSVYYFFDRAEVALKKEDNPIIRSNFYRRYGELLYRNGQADKALEKFKLSFQFAKKRQYIPFMIASCKMMDSIAIQKARYAEAYTYQQILFDCYEQSDNQADQDKMLKIELNNQAKQLQLNKIKSEEKKRKMYNLQYLILTVGISVLFIIIILLSHISVPEWLIRTLGFIGVLMFFEFIILLLDHQIHHITHGAPLYIFIIKISILSVLFPLHHIIEKRIVKYLVSQKRLWKPSKAVFVNFIHQLWPWFKKQD